MKHVALRASLDGRLVGVAASVGLLLASAGGCATIIGIDDDKFTEKDASVTTSRGDGGPAEDGGDDDDDDAPPGHDASATDAAVDSGPFVPVAGWQVDETYGSGGWVMLQAAVTADPPVIVSDDGGLVDLAASAASGGGVLVGLQIDPSATTLSLTSTPLTGVPADVAVAGGNVYLLANELRSSPEQTTSRTVVARLDDGGMTPLSSTYTLPPQGTCSGQKILDIDGDNVTVVANFLLMNVPFEGELAFVVGGSPPAPTGYHTNKTSGPPQVVADAVVVDGGYWAAGCDNCQGTPSAAYGLFTLILDDGGIPARGAFGDSSGVAASVSAVLPVDDGTAWLFGVSGGSFFASQVPGIVGGTPDPRFASPPFMAQVAVGDPTTALQQASTSRTKLVLDSAGTRLIVGARQDLPQVAVAVLAATDGGFAFASDFSARAHVVEAPAIATAVSVGGVALVPGPAGDDYAYVAAALTVPAGQQIGLLRLLRHSVRDD